MINARSERRRESKRRVRLSARQAWPVITGLGFAVAFPVFLLFIQTSLWGFETAVDVLFVMSDPTPIVDDPGRQIPSALQALRDPFYLLGYGAFGLIAAGAQLLVLRGRVHPLAWAGAGLVGFLGVGLLLVWPLGVVRAGNIPGPVEPITIVLIGGGTMGILQSLYLRRQELISGGWSARWCLGLAVGCGVSPLVFFVLGSVVPALNLRYAGNMALFGLIAGGAAGVVTAPAAAEIGTPFGDQAV